MNTLRRARRSRAGITLVEILVVVVIIAIAASGASFAFGALTRSRLRSSAMKLVAASKFAYNRAVTQGNTVRIVLDLDEAKMGLEEAHGRVVLARVDDETRRDLDDDQAAVDPWEAAKARLGDEVKPSFGASPWGPILGRDGSARKKYQARPLPGGVRVVKLIVPHEPDARTEGTGAIHYFPGGRTEHAVVQLGDASETVYSVEIHPLTGRAVVHTFAFEPEPVDVGEEVHEVEDPG